MAENVCKYNVGVSCSAHDKCEKCGWNPAFVKLWKAQNLAQDEYVKVVRCKDCVSFNTAGCDSGFGWCEMISAVRMLDHYCNYGVRRDGNK